MFSSLKRVKSICFKVKSKVTIINNYQYIQKCSIYQYHNKSSTYTFHQNIQYGSSYINTKLHYNSMKYRQMNHIYHHSRMKFTVTPLEKDGTLSLLQYGDKQIYLLGTAHISKTSADQVRKVIQEVKPDTVFVELCPERAAKMWSQIKQKNESKDNKDLAPITGEEWMDELKWAKQFKEMNTRMLKFLEGFGFVYGGEFIAALEEAEKIKANLVYGDRDVRITMQKMNDAWGKIWQNMTTSWSESWKTAWNDSWAQFKDMKQEINDTTKKQITDAWYSKSDDGKTETFGKRDDNQSWDSWFGGGGGSQQSGYKQKYAKYENMSFWEAAKAGWEESKKQREKVKKNMPKNNWSEIIGLFTNTEETIEAMKDRNKIREKFKQFEEFAPDLVEGIVHERDKIMADNLKKCKGKVIVAVVGIGHMDGMENYFKNV